MSQRNEARLFAQDKQKWYTEWDVYPVYLCQTYFWAVYYSIVLSKIGSPTFTRFLSPSCSLGKQFPTVVAQYAQGYCDLKGCCEILQVKLTAMWFDFSKRDVYHKMHLRRVWVDEEGGKESRERLQGVRTAGLEGLAVTSTFVPQTFVGEGMRWKAGHPLYNLYGHNIPCWPHALVIQSLQALLLVQMSFQVASCLHTSHCEQILMPLSEAVNWDLRMFVLLFVCLFALESNLWLPAISFPF